MCNMPGKSRYTTCTNFLIDNIHIIQMHDIHCAICITYILFLIDILCMLIFISSLIIGVLKWQFALLSNCFKLFIWIVCVLRILNELSYNYICITYIVLDWNTIYTIMLELCEIETQLEICTISNQFFVLFVYVWHIGV